ncbi:hypothetical protein LV476_08625 [Guyparkeria hydrothermalis]|uniref:hypothetical protein n=1 Tax=Guyparkeria hydrothermalis TaxID=923 RepID=UPI0020204469|nr:hypothetical protein [Guyparkeria hydrothermalis]MCL7745000.1 hypothetical protein [Guyparkeria hydrothermalis]
MEELISKQAVERFASYSLTLDFWLAVQVAVVAGAILMALAFITRKFGTMALRKTLTIATLGSDRLKKRIYQRISGLHHSGYGEFISFVTINSVLLVLTVLFLTLGDIGKIGTIQGIKSDLNKIESEAWSLLSYQEEDSVSTFQIIEKTQKQRKTIESELEKAEDTLMEIRIAIATIAAFVFYRYLTLSYVNAAQTHFRKTLDLAAPYISERERLLYISQFTQIENKKDYEELISSIKSIIGEHNIPIPPFIIW